MSASSDLPVSLDDVHAAAVRIAGVAHRTPVLRSATLDRRTGSEIHLKCENFQRVGAFKFRGALNAVSLLSPEEIERGVATHSSGNHAAALALAAALRGSSAHIVMPSNAPLVKRAAVEGYGARITLCEPTLAARESALAEIVAAEGRVEIHPYNHPAIIAGAGTSALELVEEVPGLDAVLTPVGGGGLASGTTVAVHGMSPATVVVGVEPLGADDAFRSLRDGRLHPSINPETIADGLLTALGTNTFAILSRRLHSIVRVSDTAIVEAMRLLWERAKIVVEPSGAVPLAALLEHRGQVPGHRFGLILSGGNVDLERLPW